MLNDRWAKRILRAAKTEVISSAAPDGIEHKILDREHAMTGFVKDHEKIMNYLQKENVGGHAHNLDYLLNSLNLSYHLREAFLHASVTENENDYTLSFPFGIKTIGYKLSKKAVDNE